MKDIREANGLKKMLHKIQLGSGHLTWFLFFTIELELFLLRFSYNVIYLSRREKARKMNGCCKQKRIIHVLLLYIVCRCELHVSRVSPTKDVSYILYILFVRRSSHAYRKVYRSLIYSRKQETESTLNEYQGTHKNSPSRLSRRLCTWIFVS